MLKEDTKKLQKREVFEKTEVKFKLIGERKTRNCEYLLILAIQRNIDIAWFALDEIKDSSFNAFPDIIEWTKLIYNNY